MKTTLPVVYDIEFATQQRNKMPGYTMEISFTSPLKFTADEILEGVSMIMHSILMGGVIIHGK